MNAERDDNPAHPRGEAFEDVARQQNREPSEVIEEALGRYLASRRLERLGSILKNRVRARGFR